MPLDLAHRHAARVEAQDFVVEAVEPRLALSDQQRLENAGPVAGHRDVDLAVLGQDRLRAGPVTAIAAAAAGRVPLLVAKMIAQLRTKRPLNQRLLQLLEKPVRSCEVFRLLIVSKQLIQQFRCNRRVGRHVSLLGKVNSQKPAYTFFLTPSNPVQNVSASDGPMSMPRTSRRPSLL